MAFVYMIQIELKPVINENRLDGEKKKPDKELKFTPETATVVRQPLPDNRCPTTVARQIFVLQPDKPAMRRISFDV